MIEELGHLGIENIVNVCIEMKTKANITISELPGVIQFEHTDLESS